MRILHVIPSYEPAWHLGGVVRSVGLLCRGQADIGLDVTVFATDSGRDRRMQVPLNQLVERGGVKVFYFKTDLSLKFTYSRGLRDACREAIRNYDLVNIHAFWNYPAIPAYTECLKQKVPYIIHTHGSFATYSLKMKRLKKCLYLNCFKRREMQGAAALRFTAALEREQSLSSRFGTPSFIIPNGVDIAEFDQLPDQQAAREEMGIRSDGNVILYFGRLDARKALDFLLKAFGTARQDLPETLLIFAGPDGGQEARLHSLVRSLALDSQVLFTGFIPPEKRNFILKAADLLVLATHPGENFGNVAVEAMLAGVPVLLSEHVGICREVAADGAGLVVPLKVEAIGQALITMLSDPPRLRAMGEAGAAGARRRYGSELVARQFLTAHEDILTGRRSPELSWSDG